MRDPIPEEIERGWRLVNEGKEDEALQLVNELEKREDLTLEALLECQTLKGTLMLRLGRFEESLKIGEQVIKESKILNNYLITINGIFIKFGALIHLARVVEFWDDLMYAKQLLEPLLKNPTPEVKQGELIFLFMRGWFHWVANEYDLALQHNEKCLELLKRNTRLLYLKPAILALIGHSYTGKGELEEALKALERSIKVSVGYSFYTKMNIAGSLDSIGTIHYQRGNLDSAKEYFEKSLKICEEINLTVYIGLVYYHLIATFMDKGTPKLANDYLMRYQQYFEKRRDLMSYGLLELTRARIMKSSTRTRERAEAEKKLIQLIERQDEAINRGIHGIPAEFTLAIIELCDFYLGELLSTNDMSILDDIQPLIDRLLKEAERTNSYSQRAHALLLNGNISLLRLNMGDARRYLTQAQHIADSHGLQLLAREISHEHDELLEQLGELEKYKKKKMTPSERMELASLDETMDLMQGKREINVPKPVEEDPVLLLILTDGGVLIFSHSFAKEWSFDSELFGGFLSAFNSISDEVFSEGLDRVKFGQHTVLMEPLANFSVCYLYKGQTYLAKQKLTEFTELIQETASIEQIFEKFEKTSQVLQIKDFPFLKPLITKIFLKSN